MIQNTHTRTEKYHKWKKAQRCHIKSTKRRIPCPESDSRVKFLGRYCEYCHKCVETHCGCFSSNWEDKLLNADDPSPNLPVETISSPTVNNPPVGWLESRCTIIKGKDQTIHLSQTSEVSSDSGTCMQ